MKTQIEIKYKKAIAGLNENIIKDQKEWYNYILQLPEELLVVYTVILFDSQVENGGFHQYFFNSYGQFAYLTLGSLAKIRAFKRMKLLEKALKEVNKKGLKEDEFAIMIFNRRFRPLTNFQEDLMNRLNQIDIQYYEMEEESIIDLLNAYLSK